MCILLLLYTKFCLKIEKNSSESFRLLQQVFRGDTLSQTNFLKPFETLKIPCPIQKSFPKTCYKSTKVFLEHVVFLTRP